MPSSEQNEELNQYRVEIWQNDSNRFVLKERKCSSSEAIKLAKANDKRGTVRAVWIKNLILLFYGGSNDQKSTT